MTALDLAPGATIATARLVLARAFRAAGLATPDLDARLLVGHALGLGRSALANSSDCPLGDTAIARLAGLAARRLEREPVARVVGRKEFWTLSLALSRDTLVPRPETETIVETVLAAVGDNRDCPFRIADLGTGSGAILLALLSELPAAFGIGTDLSRDALVTARHNASASALADRSRFVLCDYGGALSGPLDLIVSNPPYVRHEDIGTLDPEVRDHDPELALDGGLDGLDAYRSIARDATRLLAEDGHLVIEAGFGQAAAIGALFGAAKMIAIGSRTDLGGITRALHIRKGHAPPLAGSKAKKNLD